MSLRTTAAAVLVAACLTHPPASASDAGAPLPGAKVIVESRSGRSYGLSVEVAANDADRARGLMFRKSLPADEGMLFVFPYARPQSFWMHNTLIPLDMLFIAEDFTVLGVVQQAEPMTDTSRSVPGKAKYVLEVIGGWCADRGIGQGAKISVQGLDSIPVR